MKQFRYVVNGKPATGWLDAKVSIEELEARARTMGIHNNWQIEYREVKSEKSSKNIWRCNRHS